MELSLENDFVLPENWIKITLKQDDYEYIYIVHQEDKEDFESDSELNSFDDYIVPDDKSENEELDGLTHELQVLKKEIPQITRSDGASETSVLSEAVKYIKQLDSLDQILQKTVSAEEKLHKVFVRRLAELKREQKLSEEKSRKNQKDISNSALHCTKCNRTFSKERQLHGHKCFGGDSDYVDPFKPIISEKIDDLGNEDHGETFSDSTSDLSNNDASYSDDNLYPEDDSASEENWQKSKASHLRIKSFKLNQRNALRKGPRNLKYRGRDYKNKKLVIIDKDTDLKDILAQQKKNYFSSALSRQFKDNNYPEGDSDSVPVFSTEEEHLSFEKHMDNCDLTVVDKLFTQRTDNEFVCNLCSGTLKSKNTIRSHCLSHTDLKPYKCPQCDLTSNRRAYVFEHMRKHTKNLLKCSECEYTTWYPETLNRHRDMHSNILYVCKLCRNDYSSIRNLTLHVKAMHLDRQGNEYLQEIKLLKSKFSNRRRHCYTCMICNTTFPSQKARDEHVTRSHLKSSKSSHEVVCKFCPYIFSSDVSVEEHYKKHSLVFVCCMCHSFHSSTTCLKKHLQEHLSITDEKNNQTELSSNGNRELKHDTKGPSKEGINKGDSITEGASHQSNKIVDQSEKDEKTLESYETHDAEIPQAPESSLELQATDKTCASTDSCIHNSSNLTETKTVSKLTSKQDISSFALQSAGSSMDVLFKKSLIMSWYIPFSDLSNCDNPLDNNDKEESQMTSGVQDGFHKIYKPMNERVLQEILNKTGEVECLYCGKHFINRGLLKSHTWISHTKKGAQCDLCVGAVEKKKVESLLKYNSKISSTRRANIVKIERSSASSEQTKRCKRIIVDEDTDLLNEKFKEAIKCKREVDKENDSSSGITGENNDNVGFPVFKRDMFPPIFSTKEEDIAFKKKMDEVDLSFLDCMFTKREKEDDYICNVCQKVQLDLWNVRHHCLSHTNMKPYRCPVCDSGYTLSKTVYEHMRKHTGNLLQCSFCDYKSWNASMLRHHQNAHLNIVYVCKLCGKECNKMAKLCRHVNLMHTDSTGRDYLKIVTSKLSGRSRHLCRICKQVFSTVKNRDHHLFIAHGQTRTGKRLSSKLYSCYLCSFFSTNEKILKEHFTKHHFIFVCSVCSSIQSSVANLMLHFKEHTDTQKEAAQSLTDGIENAEKPPPETDEQLEESLFKNSISKSWYISELDSSLYRNLKDKSKGVKKHKRQDQWSKAKLSVEEISQLQQLPSDLSSIILQNYKPLNEGIFQKLRELMGDIECSDCGRCFHNDTELNIHIQKSHSSLSLTTAEESDFQNDSYDESTNADFFNDYCETEGRDTGADKKWTHFTKKRQFKRKASLDSENYDSIQEMAETDEDPEWLPESPHRIKRRRLLTREKINPWILPTEEPSSVRIPQVRTKKSQGLEEDDSMSQDKADSTDLSESFNFAAEMQDSNLTEFDETFVPVFSTDRERLAFERQVANVDLSIVDDMFTRKMSKMFVCSICRKVCQTKGNIRRHCLTHTNMKPFKCPNCRSAFNAKDRLLIHMRKHTGNQYKCPKCDLQYCRKEALILHHQRAHENSPFTLCKLCGRELRGLRALTNHIEVVHRNTLGRQYLAALRKAESASKEKIFKCHICEREFNTRASRNWHLNSHREEDTKKSNNIRCCFCPFVSFNRYALRKHFKDHKIVYVCAICNILFPSCSSLQGHLQEHVDKEKNISPSGTSEELTTEESLEKLFAESIDKSWYLPESVDADSQNPTENEVLGKVSMWEHRKLLNSMSAFSSVVLESYRKLSQEIFQKMVESLGNLECSICGERSFNGVDLDNHTVAYHGEKNYKCDYCRYTTEEIENLQNHLATVHPGKRLCCKYCEFVGLSIPQYKRHLKTHGLENYGKRTVDSKVICPFCQKKCLHPSHLKQHIFLAHRQIDKQEILKIVSSFYKSSDKASKMEFKTTSCPYCGKGFIGQATLEKHIWIHEGIKPFKCNLCNFQARTRNHLRRHEQRHNSGKSVPCDVCHRFYKNVISMLDHKKKMHEGPLKRPLPCFSCQRCDYNTRQETYFKRHMEAHEGKTIYSCDKCDYNSKYARDLQTHLEVHNERLLYSCDRCDYDTVQKNQLIMHIRIHEMKNVYTCEECDYMTHDKTRLKKHLVVHARDTVYTCDKCGYKTVKVNFLKKHETIHGDNTVYVCRKCNFGTDLRTEYREHVASHDPDKTLFWCDKCDYNSSQIWNLNKHKEVHTYGENVNYICDKCNFATYSEHKFKRHIKSHDGNALYCCYKCDFSISDRDQLKVHMQMHNSGIVEESIVVAARTPFKCTLCGYSATSQEHLKHHLDRHRVINELHCEYCEYSSGSVRYMKTHYSKKHKDKPFVAESFFDGGETTLHVQNTPAEDDSSMSLMPEEDMYKCLSCSLMFRKGNELKQHLQNEHKLFLENVDFETEGGIQVEIRTEEEAPTENQNIIIHLQETDSTCASLPATPQTIHLMEVDEETVLEEDLIKQINEQDPLDPPVPMHVINSEGQPVALNPDAIIVEQDGQYVVPDTEGSYVIQCVTEGEN